jgi:hypothetical protein
MNTASARRRTITVARRALIVQRVLVDGWTSAEAARVLGVSERQIDVWVADFRRSGMTSLRRTPGKTIVGEFVRIILWPVRGIASGLISALRRRSRREGLPEPLPLQRLNDDRHRRK